nr:riboflavin synthase subunit alpha [Larsenimonas salina]
MCFRLIGGRVFTGIVQAKAPVIAHLRQQALSQIEVELPEPMIDGLALGASVALDGCCLSVTSIEGTRVTFDMMRATLRLTTLGQREAGDVVNVERAARVGDDIGGHLMSGHIACMASIVELDTAPNNLRIWFDLPMDFTRFVLDKGYIGIDGISLTVGAVDHGRFCVNLIPETMARTTLADKGIGDSVNIEIDPQTQAIVETVERVLAAR